MVDRSHSARVECTIPVLPVTDLVASVDFYTRTMGFSLDWGDIHGGEICSVSRDGCSIMLMKRSAPTTPVWVWIGLADESLFARFRSAGAKVLQEPRNFSWAYEMKFEDPDRNVIWVGTEPRTNERFEDDC